MSHGVCGRQGAWVSARNGQPGMVEIGPKPRKGLQMALSPVRRWSLSKTLRIAAVCRTLPTCTIAWYLGRWRAQGGGGGGAR